MSQGPNPTAAFSDDHEMRVVRTQTPEPPAVRPGYVATRVFRSDLDATAREFLPGTFRSPMDRVHLAGALPVDAETVTMGELIRRADAIAVLPQHRSVIIGDL